MCWQALSALNPSSGPVVREDVPKDGWTPPLWPSLHGMPMTIQATELSPAPVRTTIATLRSGARARGTPWFSRSTGSSMMTQTSDPTDRACAVGTSSSDALRCHPSAVVGCMSTCALFRLLHDRPFRSRRAVAPYAPDTRRHDTLPFLQGRGINVRRTNHSNKKARTSASSGFSFSVSFELFE